MIDGVKPNPIKMKNQTDLEGRIKKLTPDCILSIITNQGSASLSGIER
jgi:hypothetical protein